MKRCLLVLITIVLISACSPAATPSIPTTIDEEIFFIPIQQSEGKSPEASISGTVSWRTVMAEPGLKIQQDGEVARFIVTIDPSILNLSIIQSIEDDSFLEPSYSEVPNMVCALSGGFFEEDFTPTFPLIINHQIIPGRNTSDYPTRILYINPGKVQIEPLANNESIRDSQYAIGGIDPSFHSGNASQSNKVIIATKDGQLLYLVTTYKTVDQMVEILIADGVDPNNMFLLSSGWTEQFTCRDIHFFDSSTIVGSGIIVTTPENPIIP